MDRMEHVMIDDRNSWASLPRKRLKKKDDDPTPNSGQINKT